MGRFSSENTSTSPFQSQYYCAVDSWLNNSSSRSLSSLLLLLVFFIDIWSVELEFAQYCCCKHGRTVVRIWIWSRWTPSQFFNVPSCWLTSSRSRIYEGRSSEAQISGASTYTADLYTEESSADAHLGPFIDLAQGGDKEIVVAHRFNCIHGQQ